MIMINGGKFKKFLESKVGIVIDSGLTATPSINGVWQLIKDRANDTREVKILRAIDFFEIMGDKDFEIILSSSQQALDGLAICLEAYIKERSKNKRKVIKNIFLGFTKVSEKEKEDFELERLLDIIKKITIEEIFILKKISKDKSISMKIKELVNTNQQGEIINITNCDNIGNVLPEIVGNKMYKLTLSKNKIPIIDTLFGLISLGLVNSVKLSQTKEFNLTYLGYTFYKYITD